MTTSHNPVSLFSRAPYYTLFRHLFPTNAMSLSKEAQFLELVRPAKTPLILLPPLPNRDALAGAFALAHFFTELGKEPSIAAGQIEERTKDLSFLTPPAKILSSIEGGRDFVLSFNTEHNRILNVRTERGENELRILLTPEHGTIDPRDFSFILAKYHFDVVITIDAPDKESIGKIYEDNPDIFYEVPVINIDRHSANEQYGQLNFIDVTASSASEIIAHVIESVGTEFLTETVAEALLTGIMAATDSFQQKNTTPKTLQLASSLMAHGADQQRIVRNLYKTQPLHLLKLWGRIMGKIENDETLHVMWATVTIEDLIDTRSKAEDLPNVLDKIRGNYAGATLFVLFFKENATTIRIFLKSHNEELPPSLSREFPHSELHGDLFTVELTNYSESSARDTLLSWVKKHHQ